MVKVCEQFAYDLKLKFSTNVDVIKCKTKCIVFSKTTVNYNEYASIYLNGLPLPFVKEIKHLGSVFQCDNSFIKDCDIKRAKFISKIHSLNQEFHFSDPEMVVKLYKIYACSLYGSNLWNLYSPQVLKLYNAWNVAIRILYNISRNIHCYFIGPRAGLHVRTMLLSRFISFYDSLKSSSKFSIRSLTNLSKNVKKS